MNPLHNFPPSALYLALTSHPKLGVSKREASAVSVLALTATIFGVTEEELLGPTRQHRVSHPRQIAMAALYELGYSLEGVGEFFGNRHHGTVLHARKNAPKLCALDPDFAAVVHRFRETLALPPQPPRFFPKPLSNRPFRG
jgi:chromosomal replication initiation ATPase DnaA